MGQKISLEELRAECDRIEDQFAAGTIDAEEVSARCTALGLEAWEIRDIIGERQESYR